MRTSLSRGLAFGTSETAHSSRLKNGSLNERADSLSTLLHPPVMDKNSHSSSTELFFCAPVS